MAKSPLSKLSIRNGVVRQPDTGYILACKPKLDERDVLHTEYFKWHAGTFSHWSLKFSAITCCIISVPTFALVKLAGLGTYSVNNPTSKRTGNIFKEQPIPRAYSMFRVVSTIAGKAYAAGSRGKVYRLDDIVKWVRIDEGLPATFDISAIDGFDGADIYAVGYKGAAWHFDGQKWSELDLPTNAHLRAVKCAGDGNVYVAGYGGAIIRGRGNTWEMIARGETTQNIWDLEWFEGELYLSTILFVYRLNGQKLELADFGGDLPSTCYHLSAAEGVMWSIGADDVMSFDGKSWSRIV